MYDETIKEFPSDMTDQEDNAGFIIETITYKHRFSDTEGTHKIVVKKLSDNQQLVKYVDSNDKLRYGHQKLFKMGSYELWKTYTRDCYNLSQAKKRKALTDKEANDLNV